MRRSALKSIFTFFLVLEFFAANALPASALFGGGVNIPSASQMASELENRYHLNLGSIQNQGEGFNVAGSKEPAPEVSLFFSPSDPRPGEKISAKALPVYFSNREEDLYYTWYLKRAGCDLDDNVGSGNACDADENGDITVEDWKIAAERILAQNGYDKTDTDYSDDSDSDGYSAKYGGDNKVSVPNHCYVHDPVLGTNYEVVRSLSPDSGCAGGQQPVCVIAQEQVVLEEQGGEAGFNPSETGSYYISGYPSCSSGSLSCSTGQTAKCAGSQGSITTFSDPTLTCGAISKRSADPTCFHLFPDATGRESGDGSFGVDEEQFWGTDPRDPSTADNGKKDEANVVGLGLSTFKWNYASGDKVGVAVEGTSMLPTKHDDSSSMIMWAFPKKDCSASDGDVNDTLGSYVDTIRGYAVNIPAIKLDDLDRPFEKCFEKNLVDPTEGGQATRLEVSVSATPDNPINDAGNADGTSDKGGDIVLAQASVDNAQHNVTDMLFDWKVEIKDDMNFESSEGRLDITAKLREWGLMGNVRGNALDTLRLKLDIQNDNNPEHKFSDGTKLSDYLNSSGVGYLRFKIAVTENFLGMAVRKGNSDVIVRFTSTREKISAYRAETMLSGEAMKVKLPRSAGLICNNDALDRAACRVIKNEVIGLTIDPAGLSNFYWTINGAPLFCSKKVSNDCSDTQQTSVNFFPVTGNPGDTYTVTVTANNTKTNGTGTDNVLTLSRTFGVVAPAVAIASLDRNIVWPKLLGQYRDITGSGACSNGLCNDESTSMFEALPGNTLGFRAVFTPGFLGSAAVKEWSVDGTTMAGSPVGEVSFRADKLAGGVYNINLAAQVAQADDRRRALLDIWGISPFDSPEINFFAAIQVQLMEPGLARGPESGPRRYLAAIVSYIPASLLFTFRIFLSAALIIFALSLLYAFLEERRVKAFAESFSREKR